MADAQKMMPKEDDRPLSDEEVGIEAEVEEPMGTDAAIDALAKVFADRFAFHLKAALAAKEE